MNKSFQNLNECCYRHGGSVKSTQLIAESCFSHDLVLMQVIFAVLRLTNNHMPDSLPTDQRFAKGLHNLTGQDLVAAPVGWLPYLQVNRRDHSSSFCSCRW